MKKLLLILSLVVLVGDAASISAQDFTSYPDAIGGSHVIANIGVGFGSFAYGDMKIPPILASVDFPVSVGGLPLSFGGFFAFAQSGYDYSSYSSVYTIMNFGARVNYHFNFAVPNLDLYAGASLGWMLYNHAYTGSWASLTGTSYSYFDWGVHVGVRYFFVPAVGVFAEAGYSGLTFVKAGLTLKF